MPISEAMIQKWNQILHQAISEALKAKKRDNDWIVFLRSMLI